MLTNRHVILPPVCPGLPSEQRLGRRPRSLGRCGRKGLTSGDDSMDSAARDGQFFATLLVVAKVGNWSPSCTVIDGVRAFGATRCKLGTVGGREAPSTIFQIF